MTARPRSSLAAGFAKAVWESAISMSTDGSCQFNIRRARIVLGTA
jgi:hypothetical protein